MKKIILLILISIIVIGSFSYLIQHDFFDDPKLGLVLDLINAAQIVTTFIIAFLLYDRLGTSRKLLDKQNDIVIEYIEQIKKIRFYVYHWTGEKVCSERYLGVSKNLNFKKLDNDLPVLFQTPTFFSIPEIKKLNELIGHPLFPIDIKHNLDLFGPGVMTSPLSDYRMGYVFISIHREREFNMIEWMMQGDSPQNCMTINEFISKIESQVRILEEWVNKESTIRIKLNFD